MSEFNSLHNRVVWFDIPVADLGRAAAFYRAVLGVGVETGDFGGMTFGVIEHKDGNGGCLIPNAAEISGNAGILIYMNVDKRIRAAVAETEKHGGKIVAPLHAIGPHGFRAIVLDSEGNRIALHSTVDG
jgi:uncharacterized protein